MTRTAEELARMARMAVAERRAALVQAALRIIATRGVTAATTRAITAEAGMSLASFHYAFRSRDELIAELIAYVVENEAVAASAELRPGLDLESTIRVGLLGFLDLVAADPDREMAMLELTHYALRTGDLGASARAQYASYYAAAEAVVKAAADLTGRTWSRPADEIARIVVTLTDGLTLGWLVHRDDDAVRQVVDFAARALAALADPAEEEITGQPQLPHGHRQRTTPKAAQEEITGQPQLPHGHRQRTTPKAAQEGL